MKNSEPKLCINCGTQLPWRYKGRQRIYCGDTCRNIFKEAKEKDKNGKV